MTDIFYIAGNQLFPPSQLAEFRQATFLMVESDACCRRLPFHQQKLALVLSAMREHARALEDKGYRVCYHRLEEGLSLEDALDRTARQANAGRLVHFDSEDRALVRTLARTAGRLKLKKLVRPSPMFLLDTATVDAYFAGNAQPRMSDFYRTQRRRLGVLMEGEVPRGGRWSLDTDNRARLPARQAVPELPSLRRSASTRACLRQVAEGFPDHPGDAEALWLPADRAGANAWLEHFLEQRLIGFGTYEDALSTRSASLFHSVLSPLLNIGLITPAQVVDRTLAVADESRVPLNDLEGFLRQILGWREFVRGVYRHHRHTLRRRNVWGGQRVPAASWLAGETGLYPLDRAMGNAIDYGWNHHIERLMVIANLMNLTGIQPAAAYRFFMSYYVDAYDWVMVPNLFGMGLTSDGGIFATKPYLCGSSYIRRMSDYPKGAWMDVMDGLYWRFIGRHRPALSRNPRTAMAVRALDRLDRGRLRRILSAGEDFIATHTRSAECAG